MTPRKRQTKNTTTGFDADLALLTRHSKKWDGYFSENDENEYGYRPEALEVLEKIMGLIIIHAGTHDEFRFLNRMDSYISGGGATVVSTKTDAFFRLNAFNDRDGLVISIQTDLLRGEFIQSMDDDFWLEFLGLFELGDVELIQADSDEEIPEEYRRPFEKQKSIIFRLIRNVILAKLYLNYNPYSSDRDIGELHISQDRNSASWDAIIRNILSVFRHIYRIQYMLYRAEYIRNHAKSPKAGVL